MRAPFFDVHRIEEGEHIFLIASPVKALLDYVWSQKIRVNSPLEWLHESVRISDTSFISVAELQNYLNYYKGRRMNIFIQSLQKELCKCPLP